MLSLRNVVTVVMLSAMGGEQPRAVPTPVVLLEDPSPAPEAADRLRPLRLAVGVGDEDRDRIEQRGVVRERVLILGVRARAEEDYRRRALVLRGGDGVVERRRRAVRRTHEPHRARRHAAGRGGQEVERCGRVKPALVAFVRFGGFPLRCSRATPIHVEHRETGGAQRLDELGRVVRLVVAGRDHVQQHHAGASRVAGGVEVRFQGQSV